MAFLRERPRRCAPGEGMRSRHDAAVQQLLVECCHLSPDSLGRRMSSECLCLACGTLAKPRVRNRGSSAIEIILWLCFLLPGFFYTLWRMGRKDRYCRVCNSPNPIPASSPVARNHLVGSGATIAAQLIAPIPDHSAPAAAATPQSGLVIARWSPSILQIYLLSTPALLAAGWTIAAAVSR